MPSNLRFLVKIQHHHLLCPLLIISIIPIVAGEIKTSRISGDSRPMIVFERFGFSPSGGKAAVSVSHVSWKSSNNNAKLDASSMGFFLAEESMFPMILKELDYEDKFCVLGSRYIRPMFNFTNPMADSSYAGSIALDSPGNYALAFGNCQPEFEVNMRVRFEMYNVDSDGNKNFLPASEAPLPTLYNLFFLIYASSFGLWIWICFRKNHVVDKIHLVMAALLLFKALKMICAAEDKIHVARTGTPHGWDIAFYVFGFFKGVVLFTVIVLIGTGWSILKPYLQDRERNVLIFVIPLQILENVAAVMIAETGPAAKDWRTWNQALMLIDVACCAAVFLPIVWSIRGLRDAADDGKAGRNIEKLTLFRQFYGVVVAYLYFTRIVAPAAWAAAGGGFEWGKAAAGEGASLLFYAFVFYKFRPVERNPYLAVGGGDEGVALKEGDERFEDDL